MFTFDQDVVNAGDHITVTCDTGGSSTLESDLSNASTPVNPAPAGQIDLGPAAIGSFAVSISSPSNGTYFYSWITILPANNPDNGQLTVEPLDFAPPAAPDVQPFSNDILTKYISNLTADRLLAGLTAAAAAFPADAAQAVGDTLILAVAFFPEATVPFLVASGLSLLADFFGKVNDSIVDGMVDDGSLTAPEGTFLKLVFGTAALVSGTAEFLDTPAGIDRAKSALDAADTVQDLSTAAGEMDYGLRIKTTNSAAPKAAVIIHINQLPH